MRYPLGADGCIFSCIARLCEERHHACSGQAHMASNTCGGNSLPHTHTTALLALDTTPMASPSPDVREPFLLSPLAWAWRWLTNHLVIACGCLSAGLISIMITGDSASSTAVVSSWLALTALLTGLMISAGQYCFFRHCIRDAALAMGSAGVAIAVLLGVALRYTTLSPVSGIVIGVGSSLVQWLQFKARLPDAHWWIVINSCNWAVVFWYASLFTS